MTLKTASTDAFDFQPGQGFDFAYLNSDKVTFAAGGLETVVRISTRGDLFTIVSQVGDEQTELFAGTYDEVGAHFQTIRERVFPKKRPPSNAGRWKLLVGASVLTMAAILLGMSISTTLRVDSEPRPALAPAMSPDDMRMLREYLMGPLAAGKLPNHNGSSQAQATDQTPVHDGGNMLGVPSYQPDLYKDQKPGVPVSTSAAAPDPVKSDIKIESGAKPDESGRAAEPVKAEDVGGLKEKVSAALKESKLTKEQAEKALNEISMLTPEQMQGASLDNLPPEVRQMVLDQVQTDAQSKPDPQTDNQQGGIPTKIIMLPEQVIDGYRGHDGIASLPENSSWQARGNPAVRLPLPGGGDIKTVDDLKAFGVQP